MPTLEVVVLCHLNYSVSRIDVVSVEPYDCWCWAVWFLVTELHIQILIRYFLRVTLEVAGCEMMGK